MRKRAFTLAELLIAMTIIGIVALLLVPVVQYTQEKALAISTKHFHSMMSQAIGHYMVDNDVKSLYDTKMSAKNGDYEEYINAINGINEFMFKYLNVAKVCSYDNRFDCFSERIQNINEEEGEFFVKHNGETDELKIYVLQNGNVISLIPCDIDSPAEIQVDINGKRGPNIVGRDIWQMSIYADGVISEKLHRLLMKKDSASDPSVLKEIRDKILDEQYKRCTGDDGSDIWKYGAGCFSVFEANKFKFDY